MTERTPQQQAANIMAAAAHLLVGQPGRADELNRTLAIMVGSPIDTLNLLHWADWVRCSKRNILHFSFPEEYSPLPTIAMVVVDESDRALIAESCWLWLSQSGGQCWIIPDGEGWGAYRVNADLALEHHARPPVRFGSKAAEKGYIRAYRRLKDIADEQLANCVELSSPVWLEKRAA
ncbi:MULTISPECIES: hypothetical protein [unclassified Sphingomonas]|uniref:hypothetical protein n=1 Tax=unclassified Sphingomonas TaxID=196159 RepID=UPI0006F254C8|nr:MULTISPECIES: hypothetical protein [unclassified Sphingomonas]KQS51680.1 hypothetical protein ASG20_06800 [Sphingomonas sp. Leaf198]